MSIAETFSLVGSLFSIALAVFAIWMALQQRHESQTSYEQTKDVLSKIEKVMEKTELLVSENFQNLLKSITDQQNQMLESLKPRPTRDDKIAGLIVDLAQHEDPKRLDALVDAFAKITAAQAQQQAQPAAAGALQLLQLGAMIAAAQQTQHPQQP